MNDSGELGRIIQELEVRKGEESLQNSSGSPLDRWLSTLVARHGSDLLLVPGTPPCILIDGEVHTIERRVLDGAEIEAAVLPALTGHALQIYRKTRIADSSYRVDGIGRFRINLHSERGQPATAVRALPARVPLLTDLHLPPSVYALSKLPRGLILIGGPAGSGKSTTVAALVNEINRTERRHVVIIEDPMEYEHRHERSIVEQVEVGADVPDFPTAVRSALRQAPDVIVIGEMRDAETMQTAVAAAETGHLVLSTIHTTDVATTVSRISDSFPAEKQNSIRQELAMTLAAVLTQVLLRSKKGGRFPAAELLMVGYGARQHIRRNALQHLHQEITITRKKGSFSLEDSLVQLIKQGHIDREDAELCAVHPDDLEIFLKGHVAQDHQ